MTIIDLPTRYFCTSVALRVDVLPLGFLNYLTFGFYKLDTGHTNNYDVRFVY